MFLYDLLIKSAEIGLTLQEEDGKFPKGHNGPWNDEDTYVRTTAHWALLLYKVYSITKDTRYLNASIRACDYIVAKENRPNGYTFRCRTESKKNQCNGLIGQAWAVEPLIFIGHTINNDRYINTALEVIEIHPYDFEKHGWVTVEIDGKKLGVHRTINQQIWFSCMALILGTFLENVNLLDRGIDFFSNIYQNIKFLEEGLIKHDDSNKDVKNRSLGYLTFILYGFALAYKYTKANQFWENQDLKNIIASAFKYIELNYPYGYLEEGFRWGYNPVGLEMAFATQTFCGYLDIANPQQLIKKYLHMQIKGYFDFEKGLMCKNTCDENILAARLYEAVRLNNIQNTESY